MLHPVAQISLSPLSASLPAPHPAPQQQTLLRQTLQSIYVKADQVNKVVLNLHRQHLFIHLITETLCQTNTKKGFASYSFSNVGASCHIRSYHKDYISVILRVLSKQSNYANVFFSKSIFMWVSITARQSFLS